MNIIILIMEVLYYSLFMKFARPEGKFWKYILCFTLVTMGGLSIGTNHIYSYLYLILAITYGLKYIVKLKTSLYDMFISFCLLLYKLSIELTSSFVIYFCTQNVIFTMIASCILKILMVILMKNEINLFYEKTKIKWNKNNFRIRYLFSIMMFIFVIGSCLFIILN